MAGPTPTIGFNVQREGIQRLGILAAVGQALSDDGLMTPKRRLSPNAENYAERAGSSIAVPSR